MRLIRYCLILLYPVVCLADEDRPVRCRFLCLEGSHPTEPLLNVASDGKGVSCTLPTSEPSREAVVCFAKGNTIHFVAGTDRKPAATVTVPPKLQSAILLFISAGDSGKALPWRVVVIDDSAESIPDGGAFVANFHNQDIRFIIGEKKIMLHPAGSHGFARPEPRDSFNMAPLVFQFQRDEKWITASESLLRFLPGTRYLIFAYLDPASDRPRIACYSDVRTFTPPPAAP